MFCSIALLFLVSSVVAKHCQAANKTLDTVMEESAEVKTLMDSIDDRQNPFQVEECRFFPPECPNTHEDWNHGCSLLPAKDKRRNFQIHCLNVKCPENPNEKTDIQCFGEDCTVNLCDMEQAFVKKFEVHYEANDDMELLHKMSSGMRYAGDMCAEICGEDDGCFHGAGSGFKFDRIANPDPKFTTIRYHCTCFGQNGNNEPESQGEQETNIHL